MEVYKIVSNTDLLDRDKIRYLLRLFTKPYIISKDEYESLDDNAKDLLSQAAFEVNTDQGPAIMKQLIENGYEISDKDFKRLTVLSELGEFDLQGYLKECSDFVIQIIKKGYKVSKKESRAEVLYLSLINDIPALTNQLLDIDYRISDNEYKLIKDLYEYNMFMPNANTKPRLNKKMNNTSKARRKNYLEYKSLDPNRQTGENHPKTAYVMMGHGGETDELCTVPPGCMLVVEVHSGEVNYGPYYNEFYKKPNDIFLNPIDNYKKVVQRISHKKEGSNGSKTLAIYREGDTYYDFNYQLLSFWLRRDGTIQLGDSGIIEYPFIFIPPEYFPQPPEMSPEIYSMDASINVLLDKYRMSVFPTKNTMVEKFGDTKSIGSRLNDIINFVTIKQSTLFEKLPPGVFYNLLCRATTENIRTIDPNTGKSITKNSQRISNINRSLYNKPTVPRNGFGSHITELFTKKPIANVSRKNINGNGNRNRKRQTNRRKFFSKEIQRQIEEGVQRRKPYIKDLALNTENIQDSLGIFSVDYYKVDKDKCIPPSFSNDLTNIYTIAYADTEIGLERVRQHLADIRDNPEVTKGILNESCDESHKQLLIDAYISLERYIKVKMAHDRAKNGDNNTARQYIKHGNGKWVMNSDPIGLDDRA